MRQNERRGRSPLLSIILNASSAINMIILNSQKSKKNFLDVRCKYLDYTNQLNYGQFHCPYCNSTDFIRWGGYDRTVCYINEGEIIYDIMHIHRVKCKNCNCTHALIPNFIVPYRQYLLDVILSCIANKPISDQCLCSFDTISMWKKQFSCVYSRLRTMMKKDNVIDLVLERLYHVYQEFYHVYRTILMMVHKGTLNMAYF